MGGGDVCTEQALWYASEEGLWVAWEGEERALGWVGRVAGMRGHDGSVWTRTLCLEPPIIHAHATLAAGSPVLCPRACMPVHASLMPRRAVPPPTPHLELGRDGQVLRPHELLGLGVQPACHEERAAAGAQAVELRGRCECALPLAGSGDDARGSCATGPYPSHLEQHVLARAIILGVQQTDCSVVADDKDAAGEEPGFLGVEGRLGQGRRMGDKHTLGGA